MCYFRNKFLVFLYFYSKTKNNFLCFGVKTNKMKKLYLIRHAKSCWDNPHLSDFDRPLNNRGKHDAPLMGKILKRMKIKPDVIYSSGANRAISTALIIAKELDYDEDRIIVENNIYESSIMDLIEIIHEIPDEIKTAFIVGHNPGINLLSDYISDKEIDNIPTCGIVGIEFDIKDWREVQQKTGKQILFEYPKKYKS